MARDAWWGAVAVAGVVALAGLEARSQTAAPTERDDSTLLGTATGPQVILSSGCANDASPVRGRITQWTPAQSAVDGGSVGRLDVQVASDGAAEPRSYAVALSTLVGTPFRAGDDVLVREDCRLSQLRVGGPLVYRGTTLTDPGGTLLMAYAPTGDAAFAPGWSVEAGEVYPRALRAHLPGPAEPHWLVVRYRGRVARVAPVTWRRLVADDGVWFVTGFAQNVGSRRAPRIVTGFTIVRGR